MSGHVCQIPWVCDDYEWRRPGVSGRAWGVRCVDPSRMAHDGAYPTVRRGASWECATCGDVWRGTAEGLWRPELLRERVWRRLREG